MKKYDFDNSNAFVKTFKIDPYKEGMLNGLTFAVKDLIDIGGEVTGCGNPTWAKTHPKAAVNALCVDQLLYEGAVCLGKTITDELAYSLIGENHFYGTPINPRAPARVPGGSSSGSASAVACGLVDFALGTDTGGSVRVPANNCGLWGYRPSHGRISVAGVNPLAPTFDTVGVLAKKGEILKNVATVLLGCNEFIHFSPLNIFVLEDIFSLVDSDIRQALLLGLKNLRDKHEINSIDLENLLEQKIEFKWLLDTYVQLQSSEIWSCLGSWIEENHPEFGPTTENNFYQLAKKADRSLLQEMLSRREFFEKKIHDFLAKGNILCFPTTPSLPPERGTIQPESRTAGEYYPRLLAINAISGLSRTPQITIPCAEINNIPVGLSFLSAKGSDENLLEFCVEIGKYISE